MFHLILCIDDNQEKKISKLIYFSISKIEDDIEAARRRRTKAYYTYVEESWTNDAKQKISAFDLEIGNYYIEYRRYMQEVKQIAVSNFYCIKIKDLLTSTVNLIISKKSFKCWAVLSIGLIFLLSRNHIKCNFYIRKDKYFMNHGKHHCSRRLSFYNILFLLLLFFVAFFWAFCWLK